MNNNFNIHDLDAISAKLEKGMENECIKELKKRIDNKDIILIPTEDINSIEDLSKEFTKLIEKFCDGSRNYTRGLVGNKLMSMRFDLHKLQEDLIISYLDEYLRDKREIKNSGIADALRKVGDDLIKETFKCTF